MNANYLLTLIYLIVITFNHVLHFLIQFPLNLVQPKLCFYHLLFKVPAIGFFNFGFGGQFKLLFQVLAVAQQAGFLKIQELQLHLLFETCFFSCHVNRLCELKIQIN